MSNFGTITSQMQAAIIALSLPDNPNVVIRKRFTNHNDDAFPLVVVWPEPEFETGEDETEESLIVGYPAGVGIMLDSGSELDGSREEYMMNYRQQIRQALRSVKVVIPPGSTQVVNVKAELNPIFDRSGHRINLDTSAMIFTYFVQESRNV
jgi:hypothetical protein